MALARSKVTSQGQISVPAEVRRKLGIGPGSVLEWDETDGQVVVRRAGQCSFEDVHREIFESEPEAHDLSQLKEGVSSYIRAKHGRR